MNQSTGGVLAYIGDAVLSLQVREYLVSLGYTKAKDLQKKSEIFVSAKGQAEFAHFLIQNNHLNEQEFDIFKRGRNHKSETIPKNTDVVTYRMATGLEALWGYWYLEQNQIRLRLIWDLFKTFVEENYGTIYIR